MVAESDALIAALQKVLSTDALVATSVVRAVEGGLSHCAVLIGNDGIMLEQPQLHPSSRYAWSNPCGEVVSVETTYGRVAVLVGDDAIYPEVARLLALQNVTTLLVPGNWLEPWETRSGLVERSAENRINVVAAAPAGAGCMIGVLQTDFTIMTEWQDREFDGLLSAPEVYRSAEDDSVSAVIHPLAAANKECSRNTHLVASRPWQLFLG